MNHISTSFCCSYRILRDVSFCVSQFQVIAGIQHTAVSISAAIHQAVAGFLSSGTEHYRAVKVFCQKCFGNFRTEVSKVYTKRITAGFFDILQSLNHLNFAFYDTDWTLINVICAIFLCVSFY